MASASSLMQSSQSMMVSVAERLSPLGQNSNSTEDLTQVAAAMMESKLGVAVATSVMKTANEMAESTLNILA